MWKEKMIEKKYKYTWYTKINRYYYYMLITKYKNTKNHSDKSFVIYEIEQNTNILDILRLIDTVIICC